MCEGYFITLEDYDGLIRDDMQLALFLKDMQKTDLQDVLIGINCDFKSEEIYAQSYGSWVIDTQKFIKNAL